MKSITEILGGMQILLGVIFDRPANVFCDVAGHRRTFGRAV